MNFVVLLCAYNGEKYIEEQLKSIDSQKLKPKLLYFYDWGSTDRTVDIVESFQTDIDLRIIKKEKPIGVASGFKTGIQDILIANEDFDYIALCDQDDIWLENKLSEYADSIKCMPSIDLVFSDVSTIDANGKLELPSRNHSSPYFTSELYSFDESVVFANPVVGMTILISKKLAQIYAKTNLKSEIMHDWSLVLICKLMNLHSYYIDKPLVLYRQHDNNILGNSSNKSIISILLNMPKRIKKLKNQYNEITLNLSIHKKFKHYFFIKKIPFSKIIKTKYKLVLLFFITLDYFSTNKNC
ncbi:glycosyltransferase [Providencia rettgeri]|uniref:glycosyltransferase n=1 Tax=Providencia rettgeri TaxID=587 RepID=UPI0014192782|nr:glycosyltransferase [Providencia rettgeri]NIH03331.1 glycosyltransferase [Providencia rettgeri]